MKVSRASCRTVDPIDDGRSANRSQRLRARVFEVTPVSGQRVPSLRSIAPTLPAPPETSDRTGNSAVPFDRAVEDVLAPPVSGRRRRRRSREWCVDHGVRIDTMSTFELWVAIASREVHADVRVWREGMECWTPVAQLPELACAVSDPQAVEPGFEGTGAPPTEPAAAMTPSSRPTDMSPRPTARPTPRPQDGWSRAAASEAPASFVSAARTERRPGAIPRRSARVANRHLLDLALDEALDLTPPRVPTAGDQTPGPVTAEPSSAPRRRASGARWVAAGTAVGILAMGVASLASPTGPTQPARAGIAPAAIPATLGASEEAPAESLAPEVIEREQRARREGRRRDPGQSRRRSN